MAGWPPMNDENDSGFGQLRYALCAVLFST